VAPGDQMKICTFLWVYYGYPASRYEGVSVEEMRYRCGANLARRDQKESPVEIDTVAGVPDSGTAHAVGYANASGVPFSRPFIKYTPTWPRSFMPTIQKKRDMIAKMKLIPVHEMIEGKKILLLDDSIVRGTQLKEKVEFLYESGAKEVHVRSACPPIMFGCKYLNFSRSNSDLELIARRVICEEEGENIPMDVLYDYCDPDSDRYANMIEKIRVKQHYTSLRYNRLDDLLDSVGIDKDKLCTYCWNGKE
jgi:amidophosphoribosyltransferase